LVLFPFLVRGFPSDLKKRAAWGGWRPKLWTSNSAATYPGCCSSGEAPRRSIAHSEAHPLQEYEPSSSMKRQPLQAASCTPCPGTGPPITTLCALVASLVYIVDTDRGCLSACRTSSTSSLGRKGGRGREGKERRTGGRESIHAGGRVANRCRPRATKTHVDVHTQTHAYLAIKWSFMRMGGKFLCPPSLSSV
jgi:hypothetical protein